MLVAERQGSTLYYLHTDHLSSVALTTTSTGAIHSSEQYYAYGKRDRLGAGAALPTTIDYTGQRRDGSGLIYMNARYYDPAVGVFVSPDSLVPDGTNLFDWNRYMFVRGRALNANDPSGHAGAFGGPMFDEFGSGGGGDASVLLIKTMADVATIMVGAEVARRGAQPLVAPQIHTPQESIPLAPSSSTTTGGVALEDHKSVGAVTTETGVPGSQATGFPLVQQQADDNVYQARATGLANTANSALRQLPNNLRTATIAAGFDDAGKLTLAVFGKTKQGTIDAVNTLRARGWNVLDAPAIRTPEYHAERQLYNIGITIIGISRQLGMCPSCQEFFGDKPDVTVQEYKP